MRTPDNISKHRAGWAWIYLIYTGFLFLDPLLEPSLHLWLECLLVFAIFFGIYAVYFRACDEGRPTRYWMIFATFLLGLLTFPWNPGACTFFVYTASFLAFTIPSIRRVVCLIAVECVLVLGESYYFSAPGHLFRIRWENVVIAIFLVLVVGGGNILVAEQRRADARLRVAHEENAKLAAVAERERIARDLHDVLGHTLSVIVLKAELARKLIARDPERASLEIADVETTARTALSEVREAIVGYRAQGLDAELALARRTLAAAGVTLLCEADPATVAPALRVTEETVLSLTVREAVTNIVRHAEATRCRIGLDRTPDGFHALFIEDDGPHPIRHEGNGLRGMRERVQALGGRFQLINTAGNPHRGPDNHGGPQGTTLRVELPIAFEPSTL